MEGPTRRIIVAAQAPAGPNQQVAVLSDSMRQAPLSPLLHLFARTLALHLQSESDLALTPIEKF